MVISGRDVARQQLKLLDGCLHELEDAHERDQLKVTEWLASRVGRLVPTILPGMLISDAINLVLREQERYLDDSASPVVLPATDGVDERLLDEADARELTQRIKAATRHVCLLLFEAHRRRAWRALGYTSWDQYIQGEFGMSRTRSYELLDQARVIRALQAAACMSGTPEVSAYAAEQIKPYLGEVIEVVRRRTLNASEQDALEIVSEAVLEWQRRIPRDLQQPELGAQKATGRKPAATDPIVRLRAAVESLATMPPVGEVVASMDEVVDAIALVERAAEWLAEFADQCRQRGPAPRSRPALLGEPAQGRTRGNRGMAAARGLLTGRLADGPESSVEACG